jgi:hypothetical protein
MEFSMLIRKQRTLNPSILQQTMVVDAAARHVVWSLFCPFQRQLSCRLTNDFQQSRPNNGLCSIIGIGLWIISYLGANKKTKNVELTSNPSILQQTMVVDAAAVVWSLFCPFQRQLSYRLTNDFQQSRPNNGICSIIGFGLWIIFYLFCSYCNSLVKDYIT